MYLQIGLNVLANTNVYSTLAVLHFWRQPTSRHKTFKKNSKYFPSSFERQPVWLFLLWSAHKSQIAIMSSCHLFAYSDHGVIHSDRVFSAMLATDRAIYSKDYPYADSPQSIGLRLQAFLCKRTNIAAHVCLMKVTVCFLSQASEPPSVHHTW